MGGASWYVVTKRGEKGPLSAARLRELVAQGKLTERHRVRREDRDEPVRAGEVRGLFPTEQAPAAEPAPTERVRRTRPLTPAARFRDPRVLTWIVVGLLGLVVVGHVAISLFTLRDSIMLSELMDGTFDPETVGGSDLVLLGVLSAGAIARYLVAIAFLAWLWRARKNLRALGARRVKYSVGWVIGGFLIPILNLFLPYRIVSEVWRGSDPEDGGEGSVVGLVLTWWILFVALGLADFALGPVFLDPGDGPSVTTRVLGGSVASVAVSVLAIFVVLGIDGRQRGTHARLSGSS